MKHLDTLILQATPFLVLEGGNKALVLVAVSAMIRVWSIYYYGAELEYCKFSHEILPPVLIIKVLEIALHK